MSTTELQLTIGQEIMRTKFSSNPEVHQMKQDFAKLFDKITELAMAAQKESDTVPTIYSSDTISKHMEVIKKNDEATRNYAKACEQLELACMFAIKGMTA